MAELAATSKVVLGSVAFGVFWVLAVFPAVPLLPIGRTAGSLLSAMLMVLFGVMTPEQAYAAIDLPILALLFATMVVSAYLERADLFSHLGRLLSWKSKGRKDLLCRICLVSAVASALFTNDTCCVVLTGFVLKLARQNNLPPRPFLLALASSANIGSAATPIGNPQNLIIASQSKISFGKFVLSLLPAMLVGVLVNAGILLLHYWKQLSVPKDVETSVTAADDMVAGEEVTSHRFSPATMSHLSSMNLEEWIGALDSLSRNQSVNDSGIAHAETLRNRTGAVARADQAQEGISTGTDSTAPASNSSFEVTSDASGSPERSGETDSPAAASGRISWARRMTARWKTRHLWRACVYLVTIGMLVALLMGLNMSWTALTAALVLIVLDFKDAQPCLEKVVEHQNTLPPQSSSLLISSQMVAGFVFAADIFLRDVHHRRRIQPNRVADCPLERNGAARSDRPTERHRGARCRRSSPLQHRLQRTNSAAAGSSGSDVGSEDIGGAGDEGVAGAGVGEHGRREPLAAGVGGEPDSLRAGAASAIARLQPLVLRSFEVRVSVDAGGYGRRLAAHQNLDCRNRIDRAIH